MRRVILTSLVALIHDNARLHSTVATQQLLERFKWFVSDHPAYSPDLATSDFHLFPELMNFLGGQSFQKPAGVVSPKLSRILLEKGAVSPPPAWIKNSNLL
ncbi:hypothetical protein AVEN_11504-1 [Araneus ventricosus]|uniref:Histone-lysine N-methyltransferase SETMAR n=1 Tax=Araneus ventricosus TaxID=182803 RepID=A0A4Y2G241_ARAVE|nr:hypothetical protein AVEN_11504-1 [Araneus ventricosus]